MPSLRCTCTGFFVFVVPAPVKNKTKIQRPPRSMSSWRSKGRTVVRLAVAAAVFAVGLTGAGADASSAARSFSDAALRQARVIPRLQAELKHLKETTRTEVLKAEKDIVNAEEQLVLSNSIKTDVRSRPHPPATPRAHEPLIVYMPRASQRAAIATRLTESHQDRTGVGYIFVPTDSSQLAGEASSGGGEGEASSGGEDVEDLHRIFKGWPCWPWGGDQVVCTDNDGKVSVR